MNTIGCANYEHHPDITGICKVCGQEVVTPVDDSGDPIPEDLLNIFDRLLDLELGLARDRTDAEAREEFFQLAKNLTEGEAAAYQIYRFTKLGWS